MDVYGETHTAVLGEDGYYHLDSVDGDVLVVNLKYQDIILSAALQSDRPVMYAWMTNEDGSQFKYDIGNAILEYEEVMDANGNYPLTEDLLLFYQVYAMQAGTFTFHLTGNYNEECVWMYCMRTMKLPEVTPEEPTEPETEPTEPETEPTEPETEPTEPETQPTEPTPSEPVNGEVVFNESVTADSGSKYVYTYKPTEDGTLTITVGDGSTNWNADVVYFQGVTMNTVTSANGSAAETFTVEVTANVKYMVRVSAASGALAATPLTVVFTPVGGTTPEPSEPETEPTQPSEPETEPTQPSEPETEPTEPETQPSEPTPSEPVNGELVFDDKVTADSGSKSITSYTPTEDGTLTITVGDGSTKWNADVQSVQGLSFKIVASADGSAAETFTVEVTANVKYMVRVSAASGALAETPLTIVFTPAGGTEPEQPTEPEITKDPYAVSDSTLTVGSNTVSMIETAEATIFRFRPDETGTYTVTGPAGSTIGIWGYSTAWLNNPNSTSNTMEWTCASVGQSIYVGVLGAEGQIVMNVEKAYVEPEPTQPSEPETEPTEPETEPTEPETQPSEPETEPTEPETQPTEPSVPDVPEEDVPEGTCYSITVDGTTTYYSNTTYSTLNAAIKKITGTGYVKFYQDMTFGNNSTVDVYNGTVTIDLNGCTITCSFAGAGALYVDGGNVILMDSSAEGNGVIQNTHSTGHGIEIYNTAGSCVTMLSGNVIGLNNGVKVWANASFTMEGGSVTGGGYGINALANSTVTVSGGYACNTKTSLSYPLYAASGAAVSVTGGYFAGGAVSGTGLNGAISGGCFAKSVREVYLAADCVLQDNDDATYPYKVYNPNAQPEEPAVPVAQVGEQTYTTVTEAIAAANGQTVTILQSTDEAITVNAHVTVDLAGCQLTNVTVTEGAKLMLIDSTADYSGTQGSAAVTGAVEFLTEANGNQYMVIGQDGVYAPHRYSFGITHLSLQPSVTGFGYKATFRGDEAVQNQIAAIGYDLWLDGQETVVSCTTGEFKEILSLRLTGFQVEKFGETPVHAKAVMVLADGTRLESTVRSYSMRTMVELINDTYANFTKTQLKAAANMILANETMGGWKVANITASLVPEVSVEEITVAEQTMVILGSNTTAALTLDGAYCFTAQDTVETVSTSPYAGWIADYYLTVDQPTNAGLCLAGNYGAYGWMAIPLEAGVTYTGVPVLGTLMGKSLTYAEMVTAVSTFSCGVADTVGTNTGATVTVALRLTNPENAAEFVTVCTTALVVE